MKPIKTGFVHYTASPVVGGVEAVIEAHAEVFLEAGYPVTLVAGRGEQSALPEGAGLIIIPEMDHQSPEILAISEVLETGVVPTEFALMRDRLAEALRPVLRQFDVLIIHNILTKHFNLPLTAALFKLLEAGDLPPVIAWSHDLTWTSPNSRSKVFPGYPWDLLRTYSPEIHYVAVSEQRQEELAQLYSQPLDKFEVIYNGVDPCVWYGLTPEGWELVHRLDLLSADLILLMPVRLTQAKNIELAERVLAALKVKQCNPRLVVTGPPDPYSEDSLAYYQSLQALRGNLGLSREMCFVYESGSDPDNPYFISQQLVADLLRVADLLFMPSHREGFGMPVLEAGMIGLPVVASSHIPAARELGGKNVYLFNPQAAPDEVADLILEGAVANRAWRFRRQIRQNFTWERIFHGKIDPLLRELVA